VSGKRDRKSEAVVRNVMEMIINKYNEHLTVDCIAKNYYFSSNYIGSLFKVYTAKTINEFVTKYRVCKAIEIIASSALSAASIANMCGFENVPYFHNNFKKHTGSRVSQFKSNLKLISPVQRAN
jgi:YesN/AraC family two-component response regulator